MNTSREQLEAGLKLHQAGRMDEATAIYQGVLAAEPNNADALHFLGLIAQQRGDAAQAEELITAALNIDDDRPTFHFNLGAALVAQNKNREAIVAYEKAITLKPDWAEAHLSAATLLAQAGCKEEAADGFMQAIGLNPGYAEAHNGLALALKEQGRLSEAEKACRQAIAANPEFVEAWTNLGNIQHLAGQLVAAEKAQRHAISISPDYAVAHYNLGKALADQWRVDAAIDCYQTAILKDPVYQDAWESLMLNELYQPQATEQSIYERHQAWVKSLVPVSVVEKHNLDRSPDRRLRIGYLSPDFRTHSCAYFLAPLLAAHDRSAVEVFAYANLRRADEMTERFKGLVDHWRDIIDLDDRAAVQQIKADGIDILVELAGHSANNRLGVCAYRPAPIQVTWLGYPATTGLSEIDYRLTDGITDPVGPADDFHAETLWRLEGGFHCYEGPETAPDVAPPPFERNDGVTFGSFNNIAKITPEVITAWAGILLQVAGSRLIIKGKMFDFDETKQTLRDQFTALGIERNRLELRSWISRDEDPMALYNDIDIALDTFPYNGATTTFEALWMGVPVVTLRGNRHAGCVGAGVLTHLSAPEWIAESCAQYTKIVIDLTENKEKLAEIRRDLRTRLTSSTLGDSRHFARKIEAAYRAMWRKSYGC